MLRILGAPSSKGETETSNRPPDAGEREKRAALPSLPFVPVLTGRSYLLNLSNLPKIP
jgi:hypothetical protein